MPSLRRQRRVLAARTKVTKARTRVVQNTTQAQYMLRSSVKEFGGRQHRTPRTGVEVRLFRRPGLKTRAGSLTTGSYSPKQHSAVVIAAKKAPRHDVNATMAHEYGHAMNEAERRRIRSVPVPAGRFHSLVHERYARKQRRAVNRIGRAMLASPWNEGEYDDLSDTLTKAERMHEEVRAWGQAIKAEKGHLNLAHARLALNTYATSRGLDVQPFMSRLSRYQRMWQTRRRKYGPTGRPRVAPGLRKKAA